METFSALLAICGEAGDLRRHRTHYDVIIMESLSHFVSIWKDVYLTLY